MDAWQKRFSQQLIDVIEAKIAQRTSSLVTTKAVDYADYRQRAGFIDGLKEALDDAREIEKNMDRPEGQKTVQSFMQQRYES